LIQPPSAEIFKWRCSSATMAIPSVIYMPQSNCALILRKDGANSKQFIIEGIQSQPSWRDESNATVYDAKIAIPTTIVTAEKSVIVDEGEFFRHIVDDRDAAAPHPAAAPMADGRSDLPDSRGVPSPTTVFDYIMPMVSNGDPKVSSFQRFFKTIKTDTNYEAGPVWRPLSVVAYYQICCALSVRVVPSKLRHRSVQVCDGSVLGVASAP
jgi:hypothetical protein